MTNRFESFFYQIGCNINSAGQSVKEIVLHGLEGNQYLIDIVCDFSRPLLPICIALFWNRSKTL
jgi:hypothetical protein